MDKKLEIIWQGNVPGLAEHRLSLDAFGQALEQLVTAYRRIASNLLAQADSSTGRLHSFAYLFDLQLEQIKEGSAGIVAACVIDAEPDIFGGDLIDHWTTRAVDTLLTDIEAEANGEFRNGAVRKYLRALPEGVTGQRYTFSGGNGHRREISIGSMRLPEGPTEMPVMHERTYAIVGVGFEPGESFVRLKGADDTVTCEATPQQVAKALELRFGSVRAMIVRQSGRKARLIRIRREGEELRPLSPQQEETLLFGKWHNLLGRLAK
jgi:hypothetical protein